MSSLHCEFASTILLLLQEVIDLIPLDLHDFPEKLSSLKAVFSNACHKTPRRGFWWLDCSLLIGCFLQAARRTGLQPLSLIKLAHMQSSWTVLDPGCQGSIFLDLVRV